MENKLTIFSEHYATPKYRDDIYGYLILDFQKIGDKEFFYINLNLDSENWKDTRSNKERSFTPDQLAQMEKNEFNVAEDFSNEDEMIKDLYIKLIEKDAELGKKYLPKYLAEDSEIQAAFTSVIEQEAQTEITQPENEQTSRESSETTSPTPVTQQPEEEQGL